MKKSVVAFLRRRFGYNIVSKGQRFVVWNDAPLLPPGPVCVRVFSDANNAKTDIEKFSFWLRCVEQLKYGIVIVSGSPCGLLRSAKKEFVQHGVVIVVLGDSEISRKNVTEIIKKRVISLYL